MKKFLSFLLAALLCVNLVACGTRPAPAPVDPAPPVVDPPQDDPPATVYDVAKDAVGVITARDSASRKYSFATGLVLTADGKILTNYSAVEHCAEAEILLNDKTYAITSVLAWDEDLDLAVLQCSGENLPVLPVSATLPTVGETVFAFGSPVGSAPTFGEGTVTEITAEGVYHNALSENHSGGPLLNADGMVVGFHTGRQEQGNPHGTALVSQLQNLSYDAPKTLQELYALDHAAAMTAFADWLQVKGTEADCFFTHQVESEPETFSVGYNKAENLLRVEYFHFYDSGDVYGFHLELHPTEETCRYWSDYRFAEGTEVYADGKITATEFTSKTALSMDSITMEDQRNQLGALNTAAIKTLLHWFHNTVRSAIGGEAADFGFLWHGKA